MKLFKKTYISGENSPSSKNLKKPTLEKLLIFQKMELSSPKLRKLSYYLKNFLYLRRELANRRKEKFIIFL